MRERAGRDVLVLAEDFPDPIGSGSVRAEDVVSFPDPLRNGPKEATGEARPNFRLLGVCREPNGDVLLVERAPILGQVVLQVLKDVEVGTDKASKF